MPTIGHLIIGFFLPFLVSFILNKKYLIEINLCFLAGSILPDTWTIIRIFIYPDITKYISWNITHGFMVWIIWGLIFAVIFYFLFKKFSRLQFIQIFLILLSAGWLHLGFDMSTQPVDIVGGFRLDFLDFFTSVRIMKEQDLIIVFYFVFIIIPIILLVVVINKGGLKINEDRIK